MMDVPRGGECSEGVVVIETSHIWWVRQRQHVVVGRESAGASAVLCDKGVVGGYGRGVVGGKCLELDDEGAQESRWRTTKHTATSILE